MCGKCTGTNTPKLDLTRSFFTYEGTVAQLIKGLKYGKDLTCLRAILELATPILPSLLKELPPKACDLSETCVIPVPLHKRRLKSRGFNQSLLIAKGLFPTMKICTLTVQKTVDTRPQSSLTGKERAKNIKGAFDIKKSPLPSSYFILVDDVVTTGSTLREIAKLLKKNGAKGVCALTIARTI